MGNLKSFHYGTSSNAIKPAAKPKNMGKGNPGNTPLFSTILKDTKHPIRMPTSEAKHDVRPKVRSMCPESIE
jgi:hypothetical protein